MFIRFFCTSIVAGNLFIGGEKIKLARFMYANVLGLRGDFVMFDILRSSILLRRMLYYVSKVIIRRGRFLFVGYPAGTEMIATTFRQVILKKWLHGFVGNNAHFFPCRGVCLLSSQVNMYGPFIEVQRAKLPLISILDSNMAASVAHYFVPGNPYSFGSRTFVFTLLMRSVYISSMAESLVFVSSLTRFFAFFAYCLRSYIRQKPVTISLRTGLLNLLSYKKNTKEMRRIMLRRVKLTESVIGWDLLIKSIQKLKFINKKKLLKIVKQNKRTTKFCKKRLMKDIYKKICKLKFKENRFMKTK